MNEQKVVPVTDNVHIDTGQIPAHVAMNLAQVAFSAIYRDYCRPEVQEGYQRWKAERAAKMAGGGTNIEQQD